MTDNAPPISSQKIGGVIHNLMIFGYQRGEKQFSPTHHWPAK